MIDIIRKVGVVLIGVAILVAVLNPVFGLAFDQSDAVNITEQALFDGDDRADLSGDGQLSNISVQQSLGDAVELTGANDSELRGSAELRRDGTWTASTWAELDAAGNDTRRRAIQFGGWLMVDYVAANDSWEVTYYDESSLVVYDLEASAPNETTWTHLTISASDSTLSLARNNTTVATEPLDGQSDATIPNASNWDGRIEETRLLDDVVSPTERGTLYQTPTAPVRANETARIYYDAYPSESSVDVYRTGSDLTLSNASFVAGFAGQSLSESGLFGGGDYAVDGKQIVAVDGGNLDGAPVVFVDYDAKGGPFAGILDSLANTGGAALSLLVIGSLVLAARAVFDTGGF